MIKNFLEDLKAKGWKQKEIAEKCNISKTFICELMRGDTCGIETILKIADAFKVTTDEVLGRSAQTETITPIEKLLLETTAGDDEITRAALRSAQGEKLMQEMKRVGSRERKAAA